MAARRIDDGRGNEEIPRRSVQILIVGYDVRMVPLEMNNEDIREALFSLPQVITTHVSWGV